MVDNNVEKIQIWGYRCTKCGKIYNGELSAEICCKTYYCDTCGIETKKFITRCDTCREKIIYDKATKMTEEEYYEKYPYNMVCYNNEYYCDVEDLLCCLYDSTDEETELPDYCFGTTELEIKLDALSIIDDLEEYSNCENFLVSDEAKRELEEFVENWNKKYKGSCYEENNNIVILISEETKKSIKG